MIPLLRRVLRRIGSWLAAVGGAWRRSLQLRVATTTFVITGTVVLIIGIFLLDQVTAGVLKDKRDVAIKQARLGFPSASASILSNVSATSVHRPR